MRTHCVFICIIAGCFSLLYSEAGEIHFPDVSHYSVNLHSIKVMCPYGTVEVNLSQRQKYALLSYLNQATASGSWAHRGDIVGGPTAAIEFEVIKDGIPIIEKFEVWERIALSYTREGKRYIHDNFPCGLVLEEFIFQVEESAGIKRKIITNNQ